MYVSRGLKPITNSIKSCIYIEKRIFNVYINIVQYPYARTIAWFSVTNFTRNPLILDYLFLLPHH